MAVLCSGCSCSWNWLRSRLFKVVLISALLTLSVGLTGVARAQEFDVSVDSVEDLSGLTAVVANSDDGVNLRSKPSEDGKILDTLPDGTVVDLRVDEVDTVVVDDVRWWPVRFDGKDGWIVGTYLAMSDQPSSDAPSSSSDGAGFAAGDLVEVKTDSGDGLAMRKGPSTSDKRLAGLGEGDVVEILDGPFTDDDGDSWYLISDGDISAYVFGDFLVLTQDQEEAPAAAEQRSFGSGDYVSPARGTDGVNVRKKAKKNSTLLGSVAEGYSVQVLDSASFDDDGNAWYPVEWNGGTAYMLGALLVIADGATPLTFDGPTGTFIYPLDNYVLTQGYGCTGFSVEPWNAQLGCNFHNGIDLAAPAYTPIKAADGGTVIAAGWCDCGLGFYVEIDHGNGFSSIYGHMAEQPYVSVGDEVNQGDVIGPIGSTGLSTGPHCHFIIKLNGVTVNPLDYL